ncbi:hypothetical protein Hanom_Chr06g00497671 [Helianthus anomalus]
MSFFPNTRTRTCTRTDFRYLVHVSVFSVLGCVWEKGYWHRILYRTLNVFFILCFISYYDIYGTCIDFNYLVPVRVLKN